MRPSSMEQRKFGSLVQQTKTDRSETNIFIEKNKNSSRLIKSSLRKELVLIIENNNDNNKILGNNKDEICKKIINYNELCNQNYNEKFKYTRIGKNVLQDCIKRKFWLGINFPNWLDQVFRL